MSEIKKLTSRKELLLLKESAERQRNTEKQEILICCGAGCIASGSLALKKSLEEEIAAANLNLEVKETGCMGPCSQGPVIMIQPDGIVYESLSTDDASRIIDEHIIGGNIIEDFAFQ
ncbi:MAG: (2Fe-2S) ferredoxin domain-containing protein, partial [Spirochaetales bacterium]|nr:(2Fe-2S) ferredoxin domain-containing protein [Spirochaetales bacterium]